jgi:hypothetical protein
MSLLDEDLLNPTDACRLLRCHVASFYRFAGKGVYGVVLETIRIGSRLWTSREACERFTAACTARGHGAGPAPADAPATARQRERQKAAASEKARALVG